MMKLDVNLGVEGKNLKDTDAIARTADDMGFSGIISSETKHDSFLPLAIAANGTENLELLTSVAIAFSRSPMEVAQTAWDIQNLSDGRFILGLGTQVKPHIVRRFSMEWSSPAARLKDYIGAVRAIWESFQSEGALKYEGEFYKHTLITPFFNPGPIENPGIPIYIAGVNERLCKIAGEVCDGFHIHPFHTPEYVEKTVKPAIAEGAEEAGRSASDVKLATAAFVITGGSEEEISRQREAMRSQTAFYASTPTYRTVLEAHGWGEVGDTLSNLAREKKWREMPSHITDEMLAAFAVEAAPDEVGDALREKYDGVMDRVALYLPFTPGERDDFWRSIIKSVVG